MRRILLKTAFAVAVFVLTIVFVAPAVVGWQAFLATRPGMRGLDPGHGGGGILLSIVVLVICTTISDRIVSYLFWVGGLSEGRWTVMRDRPRAGRMH